MKRTVTSLFILVCTFWMCFPPGVLPKDPLWERVDEGLSIMEFDSPNKSKFDDPRITIVKIDPKSYSFKLLCASEQGRKSMSPKQWAEKQNLICAVNAGMYQKDGVTSVGYMKNFSHINNPRLAKAYKAVLAFNPVHFDIPEIQIIDLECQDFQKLQSKYQTFIQTIRMISCRQENVWIKQDKMSGMAVFGIDRNGNALLIFTELPYSAHDFANILLSLPISIYNAMYLEGGRQAALYLSVKEFQIERVGRSITDGENDIVPVARPVPNVIGIVKKPR